MSLFVENVTPVFKNLMEVKAAFRNRDITGETNEEIHQALNEIADAEYNVMLTWAKSTTDLNPGMLKEVKAGRMNYTLAIERHLQKTLLDEQIA
jgi:hypothetical protein